MPKLASLAVVALLLAGAVLHEASAEPAGPQLTYSWPTNVGPLNPHLYAPNQMFAQASVYEPLVKVRADGIVGPWLATAWTISDDGRTYDFTLRPGVTFSDGTSFDAAAVKANFDAILANRARHDWLDLTRQIDRTEVTGPLAFRLVLKAAHEPTLKELALPRPFRFVSPAAMGPGGTTANGIEAPVGTGPWRLVETRLGLIVSASAPSVVTSYRSVPKMNGALFIVISQSGRSPDLLAATRAARAGGAVTLAIVNAGIYTRMTRTTRPSPQRVMRPPPEGWLRLDSL